ncbi:ROK family protein [Pseudonocardia sp.]|uniref:ROK family transcriptional regulator n=1 Tax=Pseudonocardia sp. TaxID=60912 RepID=UPI003D0D76BE
MSGQAAADRPGSQGALRRANRARILGELRRGRTPTQADLARETGLAPATVSNIVRDLLRDGMVAVDDSGGRRILRLSPAGSGLAASIDYGHRHVMVALADAEARIIAERRADLAQDLPAEQGLAVAARLLHEVLAEAGADLGSLAGIGMGLPAPIDSRTGTVGSPTILPGWVGLPAATLAGAAFGRPVTVDNDANLGALAELRWGCGAGTANLAYLKLSEGVGAGLIVDGRLFRGPNGTAGEIGHTTVDEFGALCRCGNRGCLETVVAARRVVDLLRPVVGRELSIGEVVAAARSGDRACARAIGDTGLQVGRAVADLCNLVNPEMIIVGGELAQAGDLLLAPMRQVIARCGVPSAVDGIRLTTATLGARAHVLGGITLAFESAAALG